jgi:hypothetical protein
MQQAEKQVEGNPDLTPELMSQVDEIIDRFAGVP